MSNNVPKSEQIIVIYVCIYVDIYIYINMYIIYNMYILYRPAMLRATLNKFQLNERINK